MTDEELRARNRFAAIALTRLLGAALLMFGIVAASGRFAALPSIVGIALTFLGAFGFAVAPRLLARRWRSPRP